MNSVSVIIPAHNSAATLVEALDSVVQQTRPVQQILVVDDVSTDNTIQVFEAWQRSVASGSAARLLRQARNTGPAGARNTGIRAASGDWVAFLDADDAWLAGRIEAQVNTAATHPTAALLCGGTVPLAPGFPPPPTVPAFRIKPLTLDDFISHNPIATSTVLTWREAILDAGLFDEQFRGPEDYDLWLRIASRHECLHLETPLARYRTRVGSLSMDERTFLPEVLAVLRKAFAPGGALAAHPRQRRRAYAEQYSSASWMAFNRGDRPAALRHLLHSWACSLAPVHKERTHDRLLRLKLLALYLGLKLK
jgi:glycosyltransferase involved in cell wall biosynthesis